MQHSLGEKPFIITAVSQSLLFFVICAYFIYLFYIIFLVRSNYLVVKLFFVCSTKPIVIQYRDFMFFICHT